LGCQEPERGNRRGGAELDNHQEGDQLANAKEKCESV
jgi:hypothetical protein